MAKVANMNHCGQNTDYDVTHTQWLECHTTVYMHHLTWDGRDWDLGGRGEGESNIHPREVGEGGEEGGKGPGRDELGRMPG